MLVLKLLQVVRPSIFCISLIHPPSLSLSLAAAVLARPSRGRSFSCCGSRPPHAAWTPAIAALIPLLIDAVVGPPPPLRLSERLRERGIDGGVEAGSTEERSIVDLAESRSSASARRSI